MKSGFIAKNKADILDKVFPEYKKISQAPNSIPYFDREEDEESWKIREREVKYKAINASGDIYLIQNPTVWKGRKYHSDGVIVRYRPPPEFLCTYEEAEKKGMERQSIRNFTERQDDDSL